MMYVFIGLAFAIVGFTLIAVGVREEEKRHVAMCPLRIFIDKQGTLHATTTFPPIHPDDPGPPAGCQ